MLIRVTKLNRDINVPIESWDNEAWAKLGDAPAIVNAMKVGLGRILNDSHAGILSKNYQGPNATQDYIKAVESAINTRVANLANADVRTAKPMTVADMAKFLADNPSLRAELMAAMGVQDAPSVAPEAPTESTANMSAAEAAVAETVAENKKGRK